MGKGDESQGKIVQAAFQLFSNQGYHGTSMRQIAEAAGLTPASIYNHFNGKEQIFREVLLRHHPYHQILPILETAEGEDAEALMREVAQRAYKILRKQKGLLHIIFIEMIEFEGRHFGQIFRSMSPRIFAFLARLKSSKGQFRKIPETSILLTLIGLIMSQWIIESVFLKNIKIPFAEKHFDHALDIYLYGILAE